MSDKIIKCKVDYEDNCDYTASTLTKDVEIPQQNVYIDIQKPQVVNINNRKGKNGNGQYYSTLTDTYYYNEILQVTTVIYREIIDGNGNVTHGDTPIKVGKISFEYYDADHPTADPVKITQSPIPIADNGLVTFNFIPHYSGYIKAYYYCEDEKDEGFYKNTKTGEIDSNSPNRNITLSKIPVYVTPNTDNIFIKKEESVNLTCDVTDIYNNKLNYGYISFMGYHDIDPEVLVNPTEGMGVMLGNPVVVKNGVASLDYSPEQDIEIEYIHGLFNYNNIRYGRDFKYYYFHNNVIRIFYIKEGDLLNIIGGKLVDGQVQTLCDFDGFIHINYGDTVRLNTVFNDDDFVFYDDMNMIIHIDYTQYHLKENFTTKKIGDLDEYIKNNATFTTGSQEIKITKKGDNNTHKYGVPYDVDNWTPGYYSVYISFDDTENKNNPDRQYYDSMESQKIYFDVDYPNVSFSLDDISCTDNKFTVQADSNFANYLKVKCNDNVPNDLTGYFIINGKEYEAVLKDNYFVMKASSVIIKNVGNYSVTFATNYYYNATTKKVYLTQFSSMPSDNPILKVRKTLNPVVNIPREYVDNEYPGDIKYQVYIENYYDGEYELKLSLYKDNTKIKDLNTIIYTGGIQEQEIHDLEVGKYKIKMEVWIDNHCEQTVESTTREITSATLQGYIAPPYDEDTEEIISGLESTIPYIISSNKAKLNNYDISNLKIWFKHEKDSNYTSYPINTVKRYEKNMYIDFLKIFYKEGKWNTYISQNVEDGVTMVVPTDTNFNAINITPHIFTAITISPVINIVKNLPNESLDIDVSTDFNQHNGQVILLQIDISYGLGETVKVYALTNNDGKISIPFSECSEDLNGPMQRQIFNIKVTINPSNKTLLNSIKNKTTTEAINIVKNHYNNFYASDNLIENFVDQIINMDYFCLFSTYKQTIKSEKYGP